ncbi:GNAT family N-acetyltransferase [Aquabacter sp. CN5-332]|uniref:GNAT family N-acetyltransferase n=1 Tax=Aquabacter sp. CN5-332 TaxID=3156608 RepID=UPI0032B4F27A
MTSILREIQALADSERNALGFLPGVAFEEAIGRQRLIAAMAENSGVRTFAGYLLYSGVFPNAKIQQIAAVPKFRKKGAAAALMTALVSELERLGFMSIRADIASDLPAALTFYARHGFERVRERAGGQVRNRTIVIHSRWLESDNLFTLASVKPEPSVELGFRHRDPGKIPVFAFDLNVYFDLVRERDQSNRARRLFGEALGHSIRLAVADEFVMELRKTSKGTSADPVLQMALQLPRLPKSDITEIDQLSAQIYDVVFVKPNAKGVGTDQAKSDARHIAHAAISRASAFITRDGPILNARNELLTRFGIDVATVEEVLDLLPSEPFASSSIPLRGEGFEVGSIDTPQLLQYLLGEKIPGGIVSEFADARSPITFVRREAIRCDGRIVAVGALVLPKSIDPVARMIIHVRHEHQDAELFGDYLLDTLVRAACESAAVTIELVHLLGQPIVNGLAVTRGFHRSANMAVFSKIAVGRPFTATTWSTVVQHVRRRTGLALPDVVPSLSGSGEIDIRTPMGASKRVSAATLENLLGPTIFVWPGCDGVIAPITRAYADELLGTAIQARLAFIANRDAAFLSQRGYVNTPRTAKQMRAGAPILFYESKGKGNGRGAVVAVARIVNSVVLPKSKVNPKSDKRLVIDNVDGFSSSDDVLLTTFDNLMAFPNPVEFKELRKFDAVGRANLVSAVSLPSEKITSILTLGWAGDKV